MAEIEMPKISVEEFSRLQDYMIEDLLQIVIERQKNNAGETAAFNILYALQMEWYETRTHSKIIFFLLNGGHGWDTQCTFLRFFLQILNVPKIFLEEKWNVYREKAFDGGTNRLDFVIESKSFCIIIEMKIEAGDGDSQLMRYDSFGRKKRKEYFICYLTIDGHKPSEQSMNGVEKNKLHCISFKKDIVCWLQKCMESVETGGFKYSFLKQYIGAVRHIAGISDEVVNMKDLLNSSDMARAAQIITDGFYEKMDDVQTLFFKKLHLLIKRKTKLESCYYSNGAYIFLESFTYRKHIYSVTFGFELYDQLVAVIGFTEETADGDFYFLRLEDAEKKFSAIYKTWMNKIESLENIQKFRRHQKSRWIYIENSRGEQLNFKNYSAQIELIDEMDFQCKFIVDNIVKHIINPLLT